MTNGLICFGISDLASRNSNDIYAFYCSNAIYIAFKQWLRFYMDSENLLS